MFALGSGKEGILGSENTLVTEKQGPSCQSIYMVNKKMKRTKIKTEHRLACSVVGGMHGFSFGGKQGLGDLVSNINLLFTHGRTLSPGLGLSLH